MSIIYTNIFNCKKLQKLLKLWFLATLLPTTVPTYPSPQCWSQALNSAYGDKCEIMCIHTYIGRYLARKRGRRRKRMKWRSEERNEASGIFLPSNFFRVCLLEVDGPHKRDRYRNKNIFLRKKWSSLIISTAS
jgi:hypothetical protein